MSQGFVHTEALVSEDADLWHAGTSLMCLLLVSPVTRRQRVFESVCDDPRLDGQLQVEVFASVDELLWVEPNLFGQVSEQAVDK